MRIISGRFKGRRFDLKVPSGVRPTADSVKESIFNILQNYIDFEDATIADICAGTGSLGFEALSRGAESCVFIDKSRAVIIYINHIADALGLGKSEYSTIMADAVKAIKKLGNQEIKPQFDLIISDPPYNTNFLSQMAQEIIRTDLLKPEGLFVVEISSSGGLEAPVAWEKLSERVFGQTKIEIFRNQTT